jgi:hypothetical protein
MLKPTMKHLAIPFLILSLLFSPACAADSRATPPAGYREITWDDLIPKDWDPMLAIKGLDFSTLKDSDPRAIEALEKLKADWDNAPVEPAIDGQQVRLAGFAIPLERSASDQNAVTELLLVPYFGACIHVPPPPVNQIVHVILKKPMPGLMTMDAIQVDGKMRVQRGDSGGLGIYGYRLNAERSKKLEP